MSQIPLNYAAKSPDEQTLLGHPKGLFVLFSTELWERFNYYGMRALLIFYLTKTYAFDDKLGTSTYGALNGLVYATPLIGGLLADRLLGYRRAIVFGGILMALGEFGLALSGFGVIPQNLYTLYLSLAFIIVGNGYFKPNISTMVGTLYRQGDPRRDAAFTIFYMGINIGASSPLLCGPLAAWKGFHWGFGLAGLGMVFGLICFVSLQRLLGNRGDAPDAARLSQRSPILLPNAMAVYVISLLAVPLGAYLVSQPHIVESYVAPIAGGGFLLYILWEAMRSTPDERKGIFVILILTMFSIMFWAFFEQAGSSISLFTDRHVNRTVLGYEIPAPVFQSVNAIFIVLLAPLFSMLWTRLGRSGRDPSSPVKFALGLFQLGVGFMALVWAARQTEGGAQAPLILLLAGYLFHTMGELCLSPVGLSMVTKMAPVRLASLLMGLWFLSSAFAHIIGGMLAGMSKEWGFDKLFLTMVYFAIGSSVLLIIISPIIKKWEQARLASHGHVKEVPVGADAQQAEPLA